jgi:hypothetical protein
MCPPLCGASVGECCCLLLVGGLLLLLLLLPAPSWGAGKLGTQRDGHLSPDAASGVAAGRLAGLFAQLPGCGRGLCEVTVTGIPMRRKGGGGDGGGGGGGGSPGDACLQSVRLLVRPLAGQLGCWVSAPGQHPPDGQPGRGSWREAGWQLRGGPGVLTWSKVGQYWAWRRRLLLHEGCVRSAALRLACLHAVMGLGGRTRPTFQPCPHTLPTAQGQRLRMAQTLKSLPLPLQLPPGCRAEDLQQLASSCHAASTMATGPAGADARPGDAWHCLLLDRSCAAAASLARHLAAGRLVPLASGAVRAPTAARAAAGTAQSPAGDSSGATGSSALSPPALPPAPGGASHVLMLHAGRTLLLGLPVQSRAPQDQQSLHLHQQAPGDPQQQLNHHHRARPAPQQQRQQRGLLELVGMDEAPAITAAPEPLPSLIEAQVGVNRSPCDDAMTQRRRGLLFWAQGRSRDAGCCGVLAAPGFHQGCRLLRSGGCPWVPPGMPAAAISGCVAGRPNGTAAVGRPNGAAAVWQAGRMVLLLACTCCGRRTLLRRLLAARGRWLQG